jgi:hypothetical protein
LEEWLSSITRLGFASEGEGSADQNALAMVIDHMAGQMEQLQMLYAQSDVSRSMADARVTELAEAVMRLTQHMESESGQAASLQRIAEGQERLIEALSGAEGGAHSDAESRMRLRSIDVQLLRILEEMSAGRQETIADLKGDIAALTQAIRQLSRTNSARG